MKQYKVIGNTTPQHNFTIGSIVTMRTVALTPDTAVFELAGESNTLQVVALADVEPVELTQQEAAAVLSRLVDSINRDISEAERIADEHGLEFSLNLEYGMGGTYYGAGHPYTKQWAEEGWNPSSMSC